MKPYKLALIGILSLLGILTSMGCASGKHNVIAATGTSIGLEVAQNPSSQMYQAKLGYNRAELAIVPSNRSSGGTNDPSFGNGAADTTDVVMELHYANIFSLQQSGIYQRLAVGKNAVSQPGAALMFAKSKDGTLDPKVAESITRAMQTIPAPDVDVTALKVPLAKAFKAQPGNEMKFHEAAKAAGYASFDDFLLDPATTASQVEAVKKGLQ
jgi:hypothetical protein